MVALLRPHPTPATPARRRSGTSGRIGTDGRVSTDGRVGGVDRFAEAAGPAGPGGVAGVRLRLVVDNGPRQLGGGATVHEPMRRGHAATGARFAGGIERSVAASDRSMLAVVAALAILVLGGFLAVRVLQGGPSAGTWAEVEQAASVNSANLESRLAAGSLRVGAPALSAGDQLLVAKAGDSMWSIAKGLSPEGDPRPVVAALIEANGGETVQIGQQIVIPGQLLD